MNRLFYFLRVRERKANVLLATAFKKLIASQQNLPNVLTANGAIVESDCKPLASALSWLLLCVCNLMLEAGKMWLLTTIVFINKFWQQTRGSFGTVSLRNESNFFCLVFVTVVSA